MEGAKNGVGRRERMKRERGMNDRDEGPGDFSFVFFPSSRIADRQSMVGRGGFPPDHL